MLWLLSDYRNMAYLIDMQLSVVKMILVNCQLITVIKCGNHNYSLKLYNCFNICCVL